MIYQEVFITEEMVGRKLGEFVPLVIPAETEGFEITYEAMRIPRYLSADSLRLQDEKTLHIQAGQEQVVCQARWLSSPRPAREL
jgi:hypothetical protein